MKLSRDQIIAVLYAVADRTAGDRVSRDDDFLIDFSHKTADLLLTEWHKDDFIEVAA